MQSKPKVTLCSFLRLLTNIINLTSMKKRRFIFMLLTLMVSTMSFAQFQGVVGTVVDGSGEPIIGATVIEKGNSQNGTITNIDGQFTMGVSEGTTLVVSYIGYETQEVVAKNQMTVTLKEDSKTLDDVVVIGYGVQKKSVVTASIAKVSAEDLAWGGDWGGAQGVNESALPVTMKVDYVCVFQQN